MDEVMWIVEVLEMDQTSNLSLAWKKRDIFKINGDVENDDYGPNTNLQFFQF